MAGMPSDTTAVPDAQQSSAGIADGAADVCRCSETGNVLGWSTGRAGCQKFSDWETPYCFVEDPASCSSANSSNIWSGLKWRSCTAPSRVLPCECASPEIAGEVSKTDLFGCQQ